MPNYVFKAALELAWSVIVSVSTVLLLALAQLDPTAIVDWRTWAIGLGVGAVRAGAGAALDWLQKHRSAVDVDPLDALAQEIRALTPEDRQRLISRLEE